MTDTPESEVAAPRDDEAPSDARTPRRSRVAVVLPWVVAVVCLGVAAFATLRWRDLADRQASVDSARAAAMSFTQDLTNWDAGDGLDDEIEVLRNQGTGPFLDEIEFVFGGSELTAQLESDGVSATGEVEEAFVQDLKGDVAEVFTVVSVTYAADEVQDQLDPVTFPASLVLERAGDGGWLVREVTIPNSNQLGQLMAPPTEG